MSYAGIDRAAARVAELRGGAPVKVARMTTPGASPIERAANRVAAIRADREAQARALAAVKAREAAALAAARALALLEIAPVALVPVRAEVAVPVSAPVAQVATPITKVTAQVSAPVAKVAKPNRPRISVADWPAEKARLEAKGYVNLVRNDDGSWRGTRMT